MPWARFSDTAAMDRRVTALMSARGADERTTNEVTGFITRLAVASAANKRDYLFDVGLAQAMSPTRWELLVKQAMDAGLVTEVRGRGNRRHWRLVEAPDDLFHIQYRSDLESQKQRDRDRKNPALTMPVLLRDGDNCRYCGVVVNWGDRKSGRQLQFDHLYPVSLFPDRVSNVDEVFVACLTCNRLRSNDMDALPRLAPPARPYFRDGSKSLEYLAAHFGAERLAELLQRPVPSGAQATPGQPAGGGAAQTETTAARGSATAPPRTAAPELQRPVTSGAQATPGQPAGGGAAQTETTAARASTDPIKRRSNGSRGGSRVGSGRDGPGGVRQGLGGAGSASAPPSPAQPPPASAGPDSAPGPQLAPGRRRGRRGGRRRPGPEGETGCAS